MSNQQQSLNCRRGNASGRQSTPNTSGRPQRSAGSLSPESDATRATEKRKRSGSTDATKSPKKKLKMDSESAENVSHAMARSEFMARIKHELCDDPKLLEQFGERCEAHLAGKADVSMVPTSVRDIAATTDNPVVDWFEEFAALVRQEPDLEMNRDNISYSPYVKRKREKQNRRQRFPASVLENYWYCWKFKLERGTGDILKNAYESYLIDIQESHYWTKHLIASCFTTKHLLEQFKERLEMLGDREQRNFTLPRFLGQSNEMKYMFTLRKIYGTERAKEIAKRLFETPYLVVIPLYNQLTKEYEKLEAERLKLLPRWMQEYGEYAPKALDYQLFKPAVRYTFVSEKKVVGQEEGQKEDEEEDE
ncbi:hypothetical protein K470DRAFT_267288 [Piedraia hortae CBS 480.64]|uniref:Uncharacterized protein n=1 Tax=Piedraia hortae CBS 480.64 TaxID=1314780 RepID=A0A6A7CB91_9PEZI|nr:hypothetical protein K470DRAFT_267288 [Piedraia hortae CBS 480.64]